ncbi:hypothetical protein SJ580_14775, partial [Enterococcus faecium]
DHLASIGKLEHSSNREFGENVAMVSGYKDYSGMLQCIDDIYIYLVWMTKDRSEMNNFKSTQIELRLILYQETWVFRSYWLNLSEIDLA